MGEATLVRRAWTRPELNRRPFIVIYELTRACHLACVHCRAEAQPHPHPLELRTDESLRLLESVAKLEPATLVFTGGDPLLRKDLELLVRHAVLSGLRVAITPSVTRRVTEAAIWHLKEWGVGASAATHDGFRQVPGTFDRTLRAMAWAREAGLLLQINTTVTKATVADLPGIAQIAEQSGVRLWSVFFAVPTGRARRESLLTPAEHEAVYEYLAELSQRVPFDIKTTAAPAYRRVVLQRRQAAGAGDVAIGPGRAPVAVNDGLGFVFISHIGDIYPSGFLPIKAGNVRRDDLAEVYQNHPLFQALRDPGQLRGKCGVCEFRDVCGGSRARAFAISGDPLAADPSCVYVPAAYAASRQSSGHGTGAVPGFSHSTRQDHKGPVGVLVMAYGTPAGPDEVEAYYTHIRHGHRPSPELLADLQRRYEAIGGVSPLLELTRKQAAGIRAALDRMDPGRFRVALGMKHARPFIEDGLAELVNGGMQRVVGLVLAPHYSALSVGEYLQRARAACVPSVAFSAVEQWHLTPGYIDFLAGRVGAVLNELVRQAGVGRERVEVIFTAHSLPARILHMDDPYPRQVRETAEAVAARAELSRWSVAWQSAGRTAEPWIGPSLLDVLAELPGRGVAGVVVCPAGFVADHLEVLYDLDIEARQFAERQGLVFGRTSLPNVDPVFCAMLAEVVRAHLEGGDG
jgi:ferrochelatase